MKNILKFLPFFLMVALLSLSCGKDDDSEDNSCETDPATTVAENIVGTWVVFEDENDTVTFNSNGTGSASAGGWFTTTGGDGNEYPNFNWTIEADGTFVVAWDYGGPPPVNSLISLDHEVTKNECDEVILEDGFSNMIDLTR